jgi:hypothetical protein
MRFIPVIIWIFACGCSASAQSVNVKRDASGNVVRDTGMNPVRGSVQSSANSPDRAIREGVAPTRFPNRDRGKVN